MPTINEEVYTLSHDTEVFIHQEALKSNRARIENIKKLIQVEGPLDVSTIIDQIRLCEKFIEITPDHPDFSENVMNTIKKGFSISLGLVNDLFHKKLQETTQIPVGNIYRVGFDSQQFSFELVPLALMKENPHNLNLGTPSVKVATHKTLVLPK